MSKTVLRKHGIIETFNISPKGSYESLLIKTKDGIVQINFPFEFGPTIAGLARQGEELNAEVLPEKAKGSSSHEIYRLVSFKGGKNGEEFSLAESDGQPRHSFSGRVQRLNYALHGEVNGAILDSGDFLHVKPRGAQILQLRVGMNVKGVGSTNAPASRNRVIEAEEVNGIQIERKPEPKKKAIPKHG